MSVDVYDISLCPVCDGMGSVVEGQQMYNNKVYDVRKPCPNNKCYQGRVGVKRKKVIGYEVDYEVKPDTIPLPT
jgi:hypothetical protein